MQANDTDLDLATNDLGPLAWVLDELRKSLESASTALRRFVRDAGLARGTDMASVDTGQLRIARQQLHQSVGAMEMVGLGAPALMLRAMEAAVQKFVERPELCSEAAAAKVERAGFALAEYLEGMLLGKPATSVALFPQYRDVQELVGADRIHPADLWPMEWRWVEPETPAVAQALGYDPALRSRLDQSVLRVVKTGDTAAAQELAQICLSLAASQTARQPKIFWKICAGYFEALRLGLLPLDLYVKRAGSRVLMQYATLAKGELGVSDRLAQDLLFFCAQAVPARPADAPALAGVRLAYGLARFAPVDYQTAQFGRFDPVLLSQSRKRITVAKETWSALAGGDANKLKGVIEQFNLVCDSLTKLHPPSAPLAQSLGQVIEAVAKSGAAPRTEVAMEVATAVLYLEAAFQDLDPTDSQLAHRTARLAQRLDGVRQGNAPEPMEPWMEELYRRVSDRQTMGSVVGELRGTLSELEKVLDAFFRNTADKAPLQGAPAHLTQMRGVLSVLGLDQAAQAVLRMRESLEEIIVTEIDDEKARATGTFEKLGNNLGALGFLIDMLNYQPTLAKKLFVYDDARGELRPLMGRTGVAQTGADEAPAAEVAMVVPSLAEVEPAPAPAGAPVMPTPAPVAAPVLAAAPAPVVMAPLQADNEEDNELLGIFLEEAREVVENGLAAIAALEANPGDVSELTTLRRAFHTLKGSSRMVGLNEFGEAGWALEQVLNTWLADQKPASDEFRALTGDAMRGFARWVDDIAGRRDGAWKSSMFRGPADTFRTEGRFIALVLPGASSEAAPAAQPEAAVAVAVADVATAAPVMTEVAAPSAPDFGFDLAAAEPVAEPVAAIEATADADLLALFEAPAAEQAAPLAEPLFAQAAALDDPLSFGATQVLRPEPTAAAEIAASDLAAEFTFDLDMAPAAPLAVEVPTPVAIEIEAIDLGSMEPAPMAAPAAPLELSFDVAFEPAADVAAPAPVPLQDEPQPMPAAELGAAAGSALELPVEALADFDFGVHTGGPEPLSEPAPLAAIDEQVKVIGTLRIGIPLYNVYLNEADEWSRRLVTEVGEWALELNQPVPDAAVGLAHALAGSSATVGFQALSDIARALEHSLQSTQPLAYGTPQHGQAFIGAAEEIRRLLHQFAAGFLKEPDPRVVQSLAALQDLEIPKRADLPEADPFALDDIDLGLSAQNAALVAAADTVGVAVDPPAQPQAPAIEASWAERLAHAPAPAPAPAAFAMQAVAAPTFAAPVPPQSPNEDEDDIDIVDAVDLDLFPIFEEEAIELMPQLGGALRQWAARPDNLGARDEVLRALHTLKGSARLAGALRLGEMAHRMESELEYLGSDSVNAADIEPLLHRFDNLQGNFDALRAGGGQPLPVPAEAPQQFAGEPRQIESQAQPEVSAQAGQPDAAAAQPAPVASPSRAVLARPVTTQLAPQRAAANQAGEVMITRSRLEVELRQLRSSLTDLTGNLDRLRAQLRDIELHSETQMQSRLAQAKDSAAGFDPLEFDRFTRVQELTRMMAESVNDVATVQRNLQRTVESTEDDLIAQGRQTRELQRDLLRTRMVEFEGISDRLYRVVRLASKETGKQVKLDITGGSIEMDRGVLDRMTPAFEHLLRNCVAHGVEDPATRVAAGKDAAGTILIHLHQEGNDVSVEFRDDGAGLNLPRIRDKALQQGMITPEQELTDAEAANLIFMPGFSTAAQVTELAGRGIGMDVVRSEVNALGGRIETSTQPGQGTSFKLVLPLTTAVTQVVMVRSGNLSIGVPANLIEIVRRAPAKDVQQAYNSGLYDFGGEPLSFYWSGALLQASQRSTEPQGKTLPVVIFRSASQRIAVHVDEVLGNQEVVVKNLGPQLSRLPGLAGMTVLASGAVVLIYNPVALTAVYGEQARQLSADQAQPEVLERSAGGGTQLPAAHVMPVAPQVPLVLVVDDSITVRRVTQRLLQREGYRVALAADGLQALERLAEERPAVVLSDIEMPRMDGFDLARNIRADERLAGLPIIMITSRIAEKHREHAMELGVNHYLGKPYSEEELLSLVKHYGTVAVATA